MTIYGDHHNYPDFQSIRAVAEAELEEELHRAAVERCKSHLRGKRVAAKWWHRFIPFTITITVKRRT